MMSLAGLVARLDRAEGPDRRLDAEIVACVLGPPHAVINDIEDLDGWGIDCAPDKDGEAAFWMAAADVPGVTAFLDAAHDLIGEARPHDGAAIMARALRTLAAPPESEPSVGFAGRAARAMLVELLRTIAIEERPSLPHKAA